MEYTTFGRTNLSVSVMGLGCGGHSRLGLARGNSEAEAIRVVEGALALGINFIDTAEHYGTEPVVGKGIKSVKREDVIISTKKWLIFDGRIITADELRTGFEQNLKRLDTNYIDIYNLHGLRLADYDYAITELLPVMRDLQQQGKIRFLGITEPFSSDSSHQMLKRAVQDECWDVIMVGFNFLNQTARLAVFPQTQPKRIATQIMFAVRNALRSTETLQKALHELAASGQVDLAHFEADNPLGFLLEEGGATSLTDAAYRFCRYEPGVDVVLVGTGSVSHLKENADSLLKPPLAPTAINQLHQLFAKVNNYSGN